MYTTKYDDDFNYLMHSETLFTKQHLKMYLLIPNPILFIKVY